MRLRALGHGLMLLALGVVAVPADVAQPGPGLEPPMLTEATPAPEHRLFRGFIENRGQWATDARFVADFGDLLVRAEPGAVVIQKQVEVDGRARLCVARLVFEGAESVQPRGGERAPGEFHYFLGQDPGLWQRHVPSYHDIVYPGIRPGVDLNLTRRDGRFTYDVLLSPSADVSHFVMRCEGVDALTLESNGDLRMDTPLGPLVQHAPIAWQVAANGETIPTVCRFRILDGRRIGFSVPDRVVGASLVIDPGLTWATFLGGMAADWPERVRVLPSGKVLVVGESRSPDFPTTAGVFDSTPGDQDATVTCLEPDGSQLVFSTFVGGSGLEQALDVDIAASGAIAFAGWTDSVDFPTLATSFDGTLSGAADAYIAMLSADGSQLLYSTLLGGSGGCVERAKGLRCSSNGLLIVAGNTCDAVPDFPVTPQAFDTTPGGTFSSDAFIAWIDPSRVGPSQLVCCSLLGGWLSETVGDLTLGANDEPIIVGESGSDDFPTTPGAYDDTAGGPYITRFAADGSSLVASTRFKGGHPLSVMEDAGTILISGHSFFADNLPATPGAFDTTWNGKSDGFIARLDSQLGGLIAATYIGGSESDSAISLSVDPAGRIVIAGVTSSPQYPTTLGAFDTVYEGPLGTSMVSYLTGDLGELLYSSYLGPATQSTSLANDVAVFGTADVVIVGEGAKSGFPVTPGAFDTTFNGGDIGGGDGYVARMLLKPLTWVPVGGAVPGSNGTPQLAGSGNLVGGQPLTLTLTSAKPVTPATLIIGLSLLNAPFKGGTLVPNPSFLIFGLSTNAHGTLALSATWPSGLPSGFTFYTQYWIPDAAGPAGFAASNGLAGTTP